MLTLDPPQVHHALAWAVGDPQGRRPDGSPNIECRRLASNATGIPTFGTASIAPGPTPSASTSGIATTDSNEAQMEPEPPRHRSGRRLEVPEAGS